MAGFVAAFGVYVFINQDEMSNSEVWIPWVALIKAQAEDKRKTLFADD